MLNVKFCEQWPDVIVALSFFALKKDGNKTTFERQTAKRHTSKVTGNMGKNKKTIKSENQKMGKWEKEGIQIL